MKQMPYNTANTHQLISEHHIYSHLINVIYQMMIY